MKKRIFITFLLIMSFMQMGNVYSLELGLMFRFENLAFAADRSPTDTSFDGVIFPWGVSFFASHDITGNFSLHTGFFQDSILRNISYTVVTYQEDFLKIGFGPFFGILNSLSSILKVGISTLVRLDFPEVIFIELSVDSSIGARLIQEGDYLQERSSVIGGFRVPNAICSLGIISKSFAQINENNEEVVDRLNKYFFSTDLYQKNIPFIIIITFAYQTLSKSYIAASTTTHTLNSILLGAKVEVEITPFLNIFLDFDSSIYTFGQDVLLGTDPGAGLGGFLFNAHLGAKLNLDHLLESEEEAEFTE